MAIVTIDRETLYIGRGRVWKVETAASAIAALGVFKIGITTGAHQLVLTNRLFSATGPVLTAALYQAAYTGGTTPRICNRRLSMNAATQPATVVQDVTATLGASLTQVTIIAGTGTGNAQIGLFGEGVAFFLEANTSYVVTLSNDGAQVADLSFTFDMRSDEVLMTVNESR